MIKTQKTEKPIDYFALRKPNCNLRHVWPPDRNASRYRFFRGINDRHYSAKLIKMYYCGDIFPAERFERLADAERFLRYLHKRVINFNKSEWQVVGISHRHGERDRDYFGHEVAWLKQSDRMAS